MLRRAVLILIENSQKFSGRHDEIKIHAESSGSEIIITVKDQGAGIPEWAELKIFDEFFSLPEPDSNQKGSGIGLSLAKHIAICHSGNLEVFNSRKIDLSEKGVTARLSVPFICDGGN
jgi:two-component system sensor histidine kinase CreC